MMMMMMMMMMINKRTSPGTARSDLHVAKFEGRVLYQPLCVTLHFQRSLMASGCIWNNGRISKTSVLDSPGLPSSTTNSLDLLPCYI